MPHLDESPEHDSSSAAFSYPVELSGEDFFNTEVNARSPLIPSFSHHAFPLHFCQLSIMLIYQNAAWSHPGGKYEHYKLTGNTELTGRGKGEREKSRDPDWRV